jgi:hypothetical protein
MSSGNGPEFGEWVRRLPQILVCGLSCGAPMNYATDDLLALYMCAPGCTRTSPVLVGDVARALLNMTCQLQSLAGLPNEERLHRLPDLILIARVGTHGWAVSVTWAQQLPRRAPAVPARPAVTRRWLGADQVLSDPPGIVYGGTPLARNTQHRSI